MPEKHRESRTQYLRDFFRKAQIDRAAKAEALAAVQDLNARLSAKGTVWSWPTIAAALTAGHPWLLVTCDSCGLTLDLDLRMKPRHPESSVRAALRDVRCPRCNGHGRPRIAALAKLPSR
jgi:hypothetical protein